MAEMELTGISWRQHVPREHDGKPRGDDSVRLHERAAGSPAFNHVLWATVRRSDHLEARPCLRARHDAARAAAAYLI